MARRSINNPTFTPTATADGSSLPASSFAFYLQGGSTTQQIKVHEISLLGQAPSSSSPSIMLLARDSQVAASSTTFTSAGCTDAALDPATAALAAPPVSGNSSGTAAQRSSTLKMLNLSLNAFGGINFWRANKWDECPTILGNTASFGEMSLSAYTGGTTGLMGAHLIYEPL